MNPHRMLQALIRSLSTRFAPGTSSLPDAQSAPLANGWLAIEQGRILPLVVSGPVEIECTAGVLWLTSADSPADLILTVGQRHVVSRADRLLVMRQGALLEPGTVTQ